MKKVAKLKLFGCLVVGSIFKNYTKGREEGTKDLEASFFGTLRDFFVYLRATTTQLFFNSEYLKIKCLNK